jgi:hypothetical protein
MITRSHMTIGTEYGIPAKQHLGSKIHMRNMRLTASILLPSSRKCPLKHVQQILQAPSRHGHVRMCAWNNESATSVIALKRFEGARTMQQAWMTGSKNG